MSRTPLAPALAGAAVLALTSTLAPISGPPSAEASGPGRPEPRPNILFVMADDLGWSDLSSGRTNLGHGNAVNETPAVDRLAQQGIVFDNAYAALNCAPTRMALMTGRYAARPDNNVYIVGDLNRGGPSTLLVGPHQGRDDGAEVLDPATVTVAENLQDAGYRTGYVGKFHVGRTPEEIVAEHGYDVNYGGGRAGSASNYFAQDGRFNDSVAPSLDPFAGDYTQEYVDREIKPYSSGVDDAALDALVGTDKHVTDAVGDATVEFIDRSVDESADQPFFGFVSTYAVHSPVGDRQARADLLAKYRAKVPAGSIARPSYAALTEQLDQSVARIVDHLETTPDPRNGGRPLADNTVVVFTSDNGGRRDLGADNDPLRGQKGELTEGGVRVPWIVWSGNRRLVRGGTLNHSPINGTDLYPTLTSWARARLPRGEVFDGVDLTAAVAKGRRVEKARFAHLPGYLVEGGRSQRPESYVRSGRWKLAYTYEDQAWRLYDLERDLGEATDLSASQPRVVAALGQLLLRWLDSTDAPLATLRDTQPPIALTVRGWTYADGVITRHRTPTVLTVVPGQELPIVLPG